jgi:pimeloyl-ACP methyl ester carboxylesterase
MEADPSNTNQIQLIFIHGAFLSSRSWEMFIDYFGERGFAVSAPEWPRKHGDVEELRESADALAGLGVRDIADHYEAIVRELEQPPVLFGHSFGGLIVELLLDRGLGRAGVAISPAPPKGILRLPLSEARVGNAALGNTSKWHGVVTLTPAQFAYAFVNTFPPDAAAAAYERYAVPDTGQVIVEAAFANFHLHPATEVDFKNGQRAPLLIVGAEKDHTAPASVARAQFKKYQHADAKTDYLEFDGRPHLSMIGEGWEEVAAGIDGWLKTVLDARLVGARVASN